tara:strand:- start:137 stop:352 length:216 start_codon:yes stop_codon:yes gene_type:complete
MYPLIKLLNTDLIKEIYHYNNYSKLDMEWFEYEHKERFNDVLIELDQYFLEPQIRNAWINHMVAILIDRFK